MRSTAPRVRVLLRVAKLSGVAYSSICSNVKTLHVNNGPVKELSLHDWAMPRRDGEHPSGSGAVTGVAGAHIF